VRWVQDLANRIGMDAATLARLDARCRKRNGMF